MKPHLGNVASKEYIYNYEFVRRYWGRGNAQFDRWITEQPTSRHKSADKFYVLEDDIILLDSDSCLVVIDGDGCNLLMYMDNESTPIPIEVEQWIAMKHF